MMTSCRRACTSPCAVGSAMAQVTEAEIEWAKDLDYRMAGWDVETGYSTPERLEELGIAWATG